MLSTRALIVASLVFLGGCLTVTPDPVPMDGQDGRDGQNCWDVDGDGAADDAEDLNGDGAVNVLDCRGPQGVQGSDGAQGPEGPDGQLRIFGDGSSGARVISANTVFADVSDANDQYTDFTVDTGVTLTVPSGTVIRCTGQFINRGTIVVDVGGSGGDRGGFDTSTLDGASREPQPGVSNRAAGNGEAGTDAAARSGGAGGEGLSAFETAVTLAVGVNAGGGGGAAFSAGGSGGGSFTVIAQGEVNHAGAINANGAAGGTGSGGGGGGFVVLASETRIVHVAGATITAKGGSGGASDAAEGPGGGGGGGAIHFLAPDISNNGATDVAGGAAGPAGVDGSVTASVRSGGGGGGATVGGGGSGGDVSAGAAATPGPAGAGGSGLFLQTLTDPKALF